MKKHATGGMYTDIYYHNTDVTTDMMDHVLDVAVGKNHTLVLRNDGTVYAMGLNSNGQLGSYVVNARPADANDESFDQTSNNNPALREYPYPVGAADYVTLHLKDALTISGDGEEKVLPMKDEDQNYVTINENQTLFLDPSKITLKHTTGFVLYNDRVTYDWQPLGGDVTLVSANENVAKVEKQANGTWAVSAVRINKPYGDTVILVKQARNAATGDRDEYGVIYLRVMQDNAELAVTSNNSSTYKITTPQIDGSYNFTVSLKSEGSVWTWGSNSYGKLGNGDMALLD